LVLAQPTVPGGDPTASRRRFLRTAFWAGAGLTVAGAVVALGRFLQTTATPQPGQVRVAADKLPKPGSAPLYVADARCYLVNLRPGEGGFRSVPGSADGGLVALYQACTHAGCKLPWRPDFVFGSVSGWFRCPCHSATYTKAGICVFGPAQRNMDTLALQREPDGAATVRVAPLLRGAPRPPAP
jgi:cytochrome b6-f complex iron-sulfur subunit